MVQAWKWGLCVLRALAPMTLSLMTFGPCCLACAQLKAPCLFLALLQPALLLRTVLNSLLAFPGAGRGPRESLWPSGHQVPMEDLWGMGGWDLARFYAAALYSQPSSWETEVAPSPEGAVMQLCYPGLDGVSLLFLWGLCLPILRGRPKLHPYFTDGKIETCAEVGFCPNGCSISGAHS